LFWAGSPTPLPSLFSGAAQQGPAHLHPVIFILQTRSSSVSTPPPPDAVPLAEMNATASSGYKKLAAALPGALAPFVSLLLPSSPSRALLPVAEQRRHGRRVGPPFRAPLLPSTSREAPPPLALPPRPMNRAKTPGITAAIADSPRRRPSATADCAADRLPPAKLPSPASPR
jgi:hypothetical protein